MSLNQSFISDFSEYYRWSQRTKIKYKLHYGWCTGRRFTAATRHNTSCSEVKYKSLMMPNTYFRDGIFNPHLATIKGYYNVKFAMNIFNQTDIVMDQKVSEAVLLEE